MTTLILTFFLRSELSLFNYVIVINKLVHTIGFVIFNCYTNEVGSSNCLKHQSNYKSIK